MAAPWLPLLLQLGSTPLCAPHGPVEAALVSFRLRADGENGKRVLTDLPVDGTRRTLSSRRTELPEALSFWSLNGLLVRSAKRGSVDTQLISRLADRDFLIRISDRITFSLRVRVPQHLPRHGGNRRPGRGLSPRPATRLRLLSSRCHDWSTGPADPTGIRVLSLTWSPLPVRPETPRRSASRHRPWA